MMTRDQRFKFFSMGRKGIGTKSCGHPENYRCCCAESQRSVEPEDTVDFISVTTNDKLAYGAAMLAENGGIV